MSGLFFSRLQTHRIFRLELQSLNRPSYLQPLYKRIFTQHLVHLYWPVETANLYELICSALYSGKSKQNCTTRMPVLESNKILNWTLIYTVH